MMAKKTPANKAKKTMAKKAKDAVAKRAKKVKAKQAEKVAARQTRCKEKSGPGRHLFRVIFRGKQYLGSAEQFHAKVVATDFATAVERACEAMQLDPTKLEGVAVTLMR